MEDAFMQLPVLQVVLLSLLAVVANLDRLMLNVGIKNPLVIGALSGLVVQDISLGIEVGVALLLVSLAVDYVGNVSLPNYSIATVLCVALYTIAPGLKEYSIAATGLIIATSFLVIELITKIINTVTIKENSEAVYSQVGVISTVILTLISVVLVLMNLGSIANMLVVLYANQPIIVKAIFIFSMILPTAIYASMMADLENPKYFVLSLLAFVICGLLVYRGYLAFNIIAAVVFIIVSYVVSKDKEFKLGVGAHE